MEGPALLPGQDLRTTLRQRAWALAGLTPAGSNDWFDHMDQGSPVLSWGSTNLSSGSFSNLAGAKGGITRFQATAAAGANAQVQGSRMLGQSAATDRWCVQFRAALAQAPAADTRAGCGILNLGGSTSAMFGCYGGLSTTNWVIQYNGVRGGSAVDTGVACNTSQHNFALWHPGDGKIYGALDGTQYGGVTFTGSPSDVCPWIDVLAPAGTAIINWDVDYYHITYPTT